MGAHRETRRLAGNYELNMAGYSVLRDPRLKPRLPQLVAGRVDRHAGLKVVHAAEHQVHGPAGQAASAAPRSQTQLVNYLCA